MADAAEGAGPRDTLSDPGVRRWLHDKYERLAAEEGELAASRTAYFAAIGTILITGLVVALADFLAEPKVLVLTTTFLAGLGILVSLVWAVLLHRTLDAQGLWREAAEQLELLTPPVEGSLPAVVTLRSGDRLSIDLLRPFQAHARRFSSDRAVSWMDRLRPGALTEVLPVVFVGLWSAVLIAVWVFVRF
jgi:hypothetical protein